MTLPFDEDLSPIPGYPGYWVTRGGDLWSEKVSRYLSNVPGRSGYISDHISLNGVATTLLRHRAVAITFLGKPPEGKTSVLHSNGVRSDNRVENLRWGSAKDNSHDSIVHGSHSSASRTHCPQGHEYTSGTTYLSATGWRRCRTCVASARKRGLPSGDPRHGKHSSYVNWGCRCTECRRANAEYIRFNRRVN